MAHIAKRTLVFGLILLVLVIGCLAYIFSTRIEFDNLTVQQLTDAGYYAYLLPDSYSAPLGWKRNIRMGMGQFDWQCGGSHASNWNPVVIQYRDGTGKWLFDISIEEQDALFEDSKATDTIAVSVDWIPTHSGISYPPGNGTRMKFKDGIGMEVVFSSYLKPDELVNLISKLEYVGPSLKSVGNPWEKACK